MNNSDKEEWGGWKIVSDMLDKPDNNGIYPTGECYQRLYEFVCAQKEKAEAKGRKLGGDEKIEAVKTYFGKMFTLYDGKLPITFFRNNMTEEERIQVVNWTLGEVEKALKSPSPTATEEPKA